MQSHETCSVFIVDSSIRMFGHLRNVVIWANMQAGSYTQQEVGVKEPEK